MIELSPKLREVFLESARLAGEWYANTQNTEASPWGGVHDSADVGRYIYEYFVTRQWARGNGVWGQAVAIMGLMTLERRVPSGGRYSVSATLAGNYLKSLQIINPTDEKCHGGFREHTPQDDWSYPRDGATGGMGFCALYKETKKEEYLDRARIFGAWYHKYGSDANGWPHVQFSFSKRVPERVGEFQPGDWQAGGALVYYWLGKLTGEKHWMDYFRQIVDPLTGMLERNTGKPEIRDFHGKSEVTYGNNDFSTIVMIAAWRQWRDMRMLDALRGYLHRLWEVQDADGTYPSFGGTFVATMSDMEYLQLCREEKLKEDLPALEERIVRAAKATLLQQETLLRDIRAYGGYYGQSNFGVSRERIHQRSTGYGMIMNLRLVGGAETPYYSSWGW